MNAKWKICICLSICVFLGTKGNYSNQVNYLHVLRSVTSIFWRYVSLLPWRRACQPISVFLPGETHRQRTLAGYSPWGCKSWTRLSNSAHNTEIYTGHMAEGSRLTRPCLRCHLVSWPPPAARPNLDSVSQ